MYIQEVYLYVLGISNPGQWQIQVLKRRGRVNAIFVKLMDIGLSFTIKKLNFHKKGRGAPPPIMAFSVAVGGT